LAAKQKADQEAAEEAKKKAEEEKKNKPFTVERLTPILSETLVSTEEGGSLRLTKPGHWTTTVQPVQANLNDFDGRITLAIVDSKQKPVALPHTRYEMVSSRPAVLAKGRPKRLENELLAPKDATKIQVRWELIDRASGAVAEQSTEPWTLMPAQQYFLVVLAKEPGRYAFLKLTDTVRAPLDDDGAAGPAHYRVVLADGNKPLPLPGNVLTWTSVAYVIWDEVNLDRIDPQQQQALVDWIHWGGRLIINGPDSLDSLRASFLARYLPADGGDRTTFSAKQLEPLERYWGRRDQGKAVKSLAVTKDWSGIQLKSRPGATALRNADGIFYEMPVGEGSVVVSAIQLTERELLNWPGFDGFLNGALLRRPARSFEVQNDGGTWVGLQATWAGHKDHERDAYFTTPVRWFARDAGTTANVTSRDVDATAPNTGAIWWGNAGDPQTEWVPDRRGGLGEWSESSPVSRVAREALREAAGVRVPAASFVVACLAIYLIVLVPLNWMVFHALGRIEWAWISAPIIAIIGTLAVVHQAQLDIGFVRSQTEIALLELQGAHPRGHLSRYTALYSSLSSTYDVEFGDSSAVATPFPHDENWNPRFGDTISTVAFEKYDKTRLRGVAIASATTQMIHSEQMIALDGPIRMFPTSTNPNLKQLENKSAYNLTDVTIVRRRFDGGGQPQVTGCWIGDLPSGSGKLVPPLSALSWKKGEIPFAIQRQSAAQSSYKRRLNVDPLLELAFRFPAASEDPIQGGREETRLVARIDDVLPGATASPRASQSAGATVVLAHLEYGGLPARVRDLNSPSDVMTEAQRNAYSKEGGEVLDAPEE
jgi:hypothetical protein